MKIDIGIKCVFFFDFSLKYVFITFQGDLYGKIAFLSDKNAIIELEGLAKSGKHKLSKSKKKKTQFKQ